MGKSFKAKFVVDIPKINIGIVKGIINNITIKFDFFAPKTNPAPSIPIKEKEIVPIIKLRQIVPITLILISKNNAITGKIIINGRPTETQ